MSCSWAVAVQPSVSCYTVAEHMLHASQPSLKALPLRTAALPQGMQELHKAAPQAPGGESDPETHQAVQRVLTVVRGTSNGATPSLTLDDVVRFYNVSRTLLCP